MRERARVLVCSLFVAGSACTPSSPRQPLVVTALNVPRSSSAPQVRSVRDLGTQYLAVDNPVSFAAGDGAASVGELVLIEGQGFGRQARVAVSGMPAEQVARTDGGGLIVRVPWGVRTGPQPFEVLNPRGRSERAFVVRRYALATVPSRDRIHVFEVDRAGIRRHGAPLKLTGARLVRYCGDGQTAYVGGQTEDGQLVIATVDMSAPGGPRLHGRQRVPGTHLLALAAAESVPLAVAISDTHLMFFDTRDTRAPPRLRPRPIPEELHGKIVAADMNAEGTLLAVLVGDNRAIIYDLGPEGELVTLASAQVLPQTTVPLVTSLSFGGEGTVWILSGDNVASLGRGRFPLRLTVMHVQVERRGASKRFGVLSAWRSLEVPHQAAPVALAVARGQPVATGQTVRIPPRNAAVFITAHDSGLLKLANTRLDGRKGLRKAVAILRGLKPLGTLVRTDIDGKGGRVFDSPSLLGAVEVTSDSQLLLIMGAQVEVRTRPAAVRLVYGVTASRVFGKPEPRFIPLEDVDPDNLARPFLLGEIRVQP